MSEMGRSMLAMTDTNPIADVPTAVGTITVQREHTSEEEFAVLITGTDLELRIFPRQARSLAAALRLVIGDPVAFADLTTDTEFSLRIQGADNES